jgi:hypothetical protein
VGQFLDVVQQAIKLQVLIHLGHASQIDARHSRVVPHVRKHRLHRAQAFACASGFWQIKPDVDLGVKAEDVTSAPRCDK